MPTHPQLVGLVLAAGAGRRYGGPKALARNADGTPWLAIAVTQLRSAGCDDVITVLGAAAELARRSVPTGARIVIADDWATGLAASLRAGLARATALGADAVVIVPVDTPDLPPAAIERVIRAADAPLVSALVRAVVDGAPSHPALIGRAHWPLLDATLCGDRGAGRYLTAHHAVTVECGDLWSGADIDVR